LEWDFGDGNTANTANASHTFSAGQHTVDLSVFSNGGCLVKKESFSFEIAGANDTTTTDTNVSVSANSNLEYHFYPNPVTDKLNITVVEPSTLKLFNMMGQLLYEEKVRDYVSIDVRDFPTGYYMLNFVGKTHNKSFKLLKNE
jgi:hypothetical protein